MGLRRSSKVNRASISDPSEEMPGIVFSRRFYKEQGMDW